MDNHPEWLSRLKHLSTAHCVTSLTPIFAKNSKWVQGSVAMVATKRLQGVTPGVKSD